jgi:hypothetical protein
MKHQCLSDDFIALYDELERFARGLYAKQNGGERELERQKERVCKRQSIG